MVNRLWIVCLAYNDGRSPAYASWCFSSLYSSFHSSNLFWRWDRIRKYSPSSSSCWGFLRARFAMRIRPDLCVAFFSQVWVSSLQNLGPLSLLRYSEFLLVYSCACWRWIWWLAMLEISFHLARSVFVAYGQYSSEAPLLRKGKRE